MKISSNEMLLINKNNNKANFNVMKEEEPQAPAFKGGFTQMAKEGANKFVSSVADKMPSATTALKAAALATIGGIALTGCSAFEREQITINNSSTTNVDLGEVTDAIMTLVTQIATLKESVDKNTESSKEDMAAMRDLVKQLVNYTLENQGLLEENNKSLGIIIEMLKAQGLKMDQIIELLMQCGVDNAKMIQLITNGNASNDKWHETISSQLTSIANNQKISADRLADIYTVTANIYNSGEETYKPMLNKLLQAINRITTSNQAIAVGTWAKIDEAIELLNNISDGTDTSNETINKLEELIKQLLEEVKAFRADFGAYVAKYDSISAAESEYRVEVLDYLSRIDSTTNVNSTKLDKIIKQKNEHHEALMNQLAILDSMSVSINESIGNNTLTLQTTIQDAADSLGVKIEDLKSLMQNFGIDIGDIMKMNTEDILEAINKNTEKLTAIDETINKYSRVMSTLPELVKLYGDSIITTINNIPENIKISVVCETDTVALNKILDAMTGIRTDMSSNHKETMTAITSGNQTLEEISAKMDSTIARNDVIIKQNEYLKSDVSAIKDNTASLVELAKSLGTSVDEVKTLLKNLKIEVTTEVDLTEVLEAINAQNELLEGQNEILEEIKTINKNGYASLKNALDDMLDVVKDIKKIGADSYTQNAIISTSVDAILEEVQKHDEMDSVKVILKEIKDKIPTDGSKTDLKEVTEWLAKIYDKIPAGCQCNPKEIVAKLEIIIKEMQKDESIVEDLEDLFSYNVEKRVNKNTVNSMFKYPTYVITPQEIANAYAKNQEAMA